VKALLFAALVALSTASCGAPLMKLPTGPGTPAPDAASVIAQATSACRAVNTITLEMAVSGKAAGRRLRGRLTAGLARPASARLEAVAPFGGPIFVFVASGDDASLLLPRDRRVLEHGNAPDVLEAVSGVPLDAAALRSLVTGCANAADASDAVAFGDDWRVAPDGAENVYFRRDGANGRWRLVSTTKRGAWRADYSTFENGLPNAVHLMSQPAGRFDLQMRFSQVEVNVTLGPEAFRLQKVGEAAPITLDELRESGPLGVK
jgi:hypothetical protein